jgi:uncharacterized membrane protein YcaP (DUF421 family)
MVPVWSVNWEVLLLPGVGIPELVLRGTLAYVGLFFLLRFLQTRSALGALGLLDLLVIVLMASAMSEAMVGEARSVTGGFIVVLTILFWNFSFNWLASRFPRLEHLFHPEPLLLVRQGRLVRRNLQREHLTEEELRSQLRGQGIADVTAVEKAYMEPDGHVSAIRREGGGRPPRRRRHRGGHFSGPGRGG